MTPRCNFRGSEGHSLSLDGNDAPIANDNTLAIARGMTSFGTGCRRRQNRGNKTAIELFLGGVAGWDTGLRRRLDDGKSNPD